MDGSSRSWDHSTNSAFKKKWRSLRDCLRRRNRAAVWWRQLLWWLYRHGVVFFLIIQLLLTAVLVHQHVKTGIPHNEPLRLYANLLADIASKLPRAEGLAFGRVSYSVVYIVLSLLIPFAITLFCRKLILYYLLPGNKTALVDAMLDRCTEVTTIAHKRVRAFISEVTEWVDGLRTGVDVDRQACAVLGREIVEACSSKKVFATCLQTPESVYSNLRDFSEIVAAEVRARKIHLDRVLVVNSSSPSWDSPAAKWFGKLHQDEQDKVGLTLYTIGKEQFKQIASLCAIPPEKLDVMLFDGRVVYALLNSPEDLTVQSGSGKYRLYLMDSDEMLLAYGRFRDKILDVASKVSLNENPTDT